MHTAILRGHRIVCLISFACFQGRGRRGPQLPERVRRSLNPTLYRNIEYDVWHKTKKGEMNGRMWINCERNVSDEKRKGAQRNVEKKTNMILLQRNRKWTTASQPGCSLLLETSVRSVLDTSALLGQAENLVLRIFLSSHGIGIACRFVSKGVGGATVPL